MAKRADPRAAAADVLLEIGTEEIPARFLPGARRQLHDLAAQAVFDHGLATGKEGVETFATPRRLVVVIRRVPARQQDRDIKVLGPARAQAFAPDGKPTRAAEGFARKHGVTVEELKEENTDKGIRLAYVATREGMAADAVLPIVLAGVIDGLEFPKSMRWPQSPGSFARPVRWLLALHGGNPLAVAAAGLTSGSHTRGRRFVHPKPIPVRSVPDYFKVMKRCGIELDSHRREDVIGKGAGKLAAGVKGTVHENPALLGEVSDLVEAPVVMMGEFPRDALALPAAVVVAAMQEHQRYFPVWAGPVLSPHFVFVANGVGTDAVRAGNERVLKARLSDAAFFFHEDRKKKLEDFLPQLETVVWQTGAGSLMDKSLRVEKLAGWLADRVGADSAVVRRAGRLCKADLVTQMVFEFPGLQGVTGGIYAEADGEPEGVWKAIAEHYRPRGPRDEPPPQDEGCVLSVADRIDSLVGHFALGHVPSGTADPYGLRRAGIGIVRVILERGWSHLGLTEVIRQAASGFAGQGLEIRDEPALVRQTLKFVQDRLEVIFAERKRPHDEIRAALGSFDDVVLAERRLAALQDLRGREDFRDVVFALSRVTNILSDDVKSVAMNPAELDSEERALFDAHESVRESVRQLANDGRFTVLFEQLAGLRPAIDRFFDKVLVMDKDEAIRNRRLALLGEVAKSIRLFADVKQLVIT